METFNFKPNRPQPNFCALVYIPESVDCPLPTVKNIILLVMRDAECGLRFLIHPRLRQIVKAIDLPYIESLLDDFIERIKLNAELLFKQLCSLSAGLLRTRAVGEQIADHPDIYDLALLFVPIYRISHNRVTQWVKKGAPRGAGKKTAAWIGAHEPCRCARRLRPRQVRQHSGWPIADL